MKISKSCSLKGRQYAFAFHMGKVYSCCKAYPELLDDSRNLDSYVQQWEQERQQLDDGVMLENCELCWQHEQKNQISHRILNKNHNPTVIKVELGFDNLCNQMCSYCSPMFSSQWEDNIRTNGNYNNISTTARNNLAVFNQQKSNIDYWLDQLSNLVISRPDITWDIAILGGEPLMQFRNLEKFLNTVNQHVDKIRITTNLNPPNNKFLIWIVENFTSDKLSFNVSLDTTPEFNHWPRAFFNKESFLENLELLKKHNVAVKFNAVVTALSVFDVPDFLRWIQEHKITGEFKQVSNPDCFSPLLIDYSLRQEIKNRCTTEIPDTFEKIFEHNGPNNVVKQIEQYQYYKQYFDRSNLDPALIPNDLFQTHWHQLSSIVQSKIRSAID